MNTIQPSTTNINQVKGMMSAHGWPVRKRERDDDDESNTLSFSEHRTKRRIASLPHRISPKTSRSVSTTFESWNSHYSTHPAPPTITPADSDSEEAAAALVAAEPRSFYTPISSSQAQTIAHGSPSPFYNPSNFINNSHSTQTSTSFSEDFEMTDTMHLSPGSFQNDPSPSISGRIPTPIHSSFGPIIRPENAFTNNSPSFADDETLVDRFRRGRRLPSPISEGETSPSVIIAGFGGMQMEVDHPPSQEPERETPTKKGHTRSKHSLRAWTGLGGETGIPSAGMKRTFSMGYRADCEKCRNRVPGHFSHIITID